MQTRVDGPIYEKTKPFGEQYVQAREGLAKIVAVMLQQHSPRGVLKKRLLKRLHSLFVTEISFFEECLERFSNSKSS